MTMTTFMTLLSLVEHRNCVACELRLNSRRHIVSVCQDLLCAGIRPHLGCGVGSEPWRTVADENAAGTNNCALNCTLRLLVEDADDVAFRAAISGLAAYCEHNTRHLVDESHCIVALNERRLDQLTDVDWPAGLQHAACGKAHRLLASGDDVATDIGARPPLHLYVRFLEDTAVFDRPRHGCDLDRCDSASGEVHHRSLACASSNFERRLKTPAARVIFHLRDPYRALRGRLHVHGAHITRESYGDVLGWTEIEARGQSAGDCVFDVLGRDRPARARNDDVAYAIGRYPDEGMAADSLKHSIGRDCPRISEVWRAKYWYRRNNARVFDEIADTHDIALDDCFRFQGRALRAGLSGSLRAGWNTKCTKCGERNGGGGD